jgi:hypothetical protein
MKPLEGGTPSTVCSLHVYVVDRATKRRHLLKALENLIHISVAAATESVVPIHFPSWPRFPDGLVLVYVVYPE